MDNILHKDTGIGAVLGDSSSSRSGSSTSNTKTYTLSDGTVLTLTDTVYKYRNKVFDEAYGLAYSSNIAAPSRDEMMKGNINSELNALRKRYTDKTGNTFVQLSDGSLLTMPVSDYNERNAIYTQAYGLAYSYNVAAPDFDECFKGNGAAELQKVQGRIVAKQAAAQVAEAQAAAQAAEEEEANQAPETQSEDNALALKLAEDMKKIGFQYDPGSGKWVNGYGEEYQAQEDFFIKDSDSSHTDTTPTPRRTDTDYVAPEHQDSNQPRTSATAAAAVSPSTSDGANNGLLWLLLGAAAIGLVFMSSKSNSKKRKRR